MTGTAIPEGTSEAIPTSEATRSSDAIPGGFELHFRKSPLTEPWEPLYSRKSDDGVSIGLRLAVPHTNSRGFAHGGLITALADNAMGLSCGVKLGGSRLVTISLGIDFIGNAKIGQWLQVNCEVIKAGSTICFAQSVVTADDAICARANGTFRVISP